LKTFVKPQYRHISKAADAKTLDKLLQNVYTWAMENVDNKGGSMREYLGSQLYQVGRFAEWMATAEPCKLGIGGKHVYVYVLPTSWASKVVERYGGMARVTIPLRQLHKQEVIAEIIMNAVTHDWQPLAYGAVVLGDTIAAYIVPALPYWRAKVEGDNQIPRPSGRPPETREGEG
jgi:hypothetical protein